MSRILNIALAAAIVIAPIASASAQTMAPTAKAPAKKMSREKLRGMKQNWSKNKPKLDACKKQVKSKGLAGDDRWFFMEECMGKS